MKKPFELFVIFSATKDNVEDVPGSVNGSSILETANLMKQSVFMSPTFVSSTAPETVTETEESIQDGNELSVVNNIANNNADKIEFRNSVMNPAYNVTMHSKDFEKYQSIKEYEVENDSGDFILRNVSYETRNNANIDRSSLNKTSPVDDHADEAYSSDGSNSYPGTCSEITNNNFEAASKQSKPSNKIKILSEQIINHSDLNTIPNSRIQKSSSCFLIPVNTIVTGKATKNRSLNHLEQKTVQEKLCTTPELNLKIHDEIREVVNNSETVENKNTVVEGSLTVTHSGSVVPNDEKEDTSHKVETHDCNKNNGEIVLDFDKCIIPKEEDMKIKKISENGKDEMLKVKTMNDSAKEIASNTESSSSQSKLCIQGVEKPGGMPENKIDTVLKTYQRTNIQKQTPKLSHVDYTNIVDSNILPKGEVKELDEINMGGYKNANQFCICSDFGQLENYDSDISYEHIHFCDHNNAGCNLETLFSMYDDTSVLREINITKDIDVVNDVIENTQHNICWLSFKCEDNEAVELACFETENLDESNVTGQPRRSVSVFFYF